MYILDLWSILLQTTLFTYIASGIGFIFLWRMKVLLKMHCYRPRNLPIERQSSILQTIISNFAFIFGAPPFILSTYRKVDRRSFAITTLTEYQVLASSALDIKAVSESSEDELSFHAAMTDRLKHKYTMFGFEHNDVDPHNTVASRTLKVMLRLHLPALRREIQNSIAEGFQAYFGKLSTVTSDWHRVSAFRLSRQITDNVNCRAFLGPELARSQAFMDSALRYSNHAIITAEICRQLPSIFTPILAPVMMKCTGSMHRVAASIRKVIEARVVEMNEKPDIATTHMDCIQWIIQSSKTVAQRKIDRLVQQVVALYFASSHQMPMALVYAIYSLCIHDEYVELLRNEATYASGNNGKDPLQHMQLLDAFLRESARLNPLDALSLQRKVMKSFKLPCGAFVPAGNLIAVPQQAILMDGDIYLNPDQFDPYRYLPYGNRLKCEDLTIKYTDVSIEYPYWGSPKKSCPGRWYVSDTLKLALVHLITNYDFKLENTTTSRTFYWTTAMVPRSSATILMRKRA